MRKLAIIIILIAFPLTAFAKEHTFRKTTWGMTVKQVKASEQSKPVEEGNKVLFYETAINNREMGLMYVFYNKELVRAIYYLIGDDINENSYIAEYHSLKRLLIKKYGKPITDKIIQKDEKDHKNRIKAIRSDLLEYKSEWKPKSHSWDTDMRIELSLAGVNNMIRCCIVYDGPMDTILKKFKEKQTLNVL